MFRKVLVANRGEIATRILRACAESNVRTVAVYSEADRWAGFVSRADEAYLLGAAHPEDSYLNVEKILDVARRTRAQAIHPGYGFLAENAAFARACRKNRIAFIGPPPEAIERIGNKLNGRQIAQTVGVPVVPGMDRVATESDARAFARKHGYPLLIKAAGGGGGRGMRIVTRDEDLAKLLREASGEAATYFKDGTVFLEKFIERPRHVEVQIIADAHGHVFHLFERDCSTQRRHQKLIEESPSPAVDEDLRRKLTEAATKLIAAAGYVNAGTCEFLVDAHKNFYFLEVNTRLQVEHPVTEMVTGLDLVKLQLAVAAGEKLTIQPQLSGHAIECRILAEDPYSGFAPSLGRIAAFRLPGGPSVRIDTDLAANSVVTPYYDSLIAKLVAWGSTRTQAIERMQRALGEFQIVGIATTIPFHQEMLSSKAFRDGRVHTRFVEMEMTLQSRPACIEATLLAAALEFESRERTAVRFHSSRVLSAWKTAIQDGPP